MAPPPRCSYTYHEWKLRMSIGGKEGEREYVRQTDRQERDGKIEKREGPRLKKVMEKTHVKFYVKDKINNPHPLRTFRAQGWNVGQVDCEHYRSQLGFCVTAPGDRSQPEVEVQALSRMRGFSREEPGRPLSHVCPGPYGSFSCASNPDRAYRNLLFIELGQVVAKRVWVSTSTVTRHRK